MLTAVALHERACEEVVSVMGFGGACLLITALCLSKSNLFICPLPPEGTGPAERQGRGFCQSGGAVITISLTALHQRDIASESV